MEGGTIGGTRIATAGCSPCKVCFAPVPWVFEVASVVHVVMPEDAGAIASKVNMTVSPCCRTASSSVAVMFIVVVDRVQSQDDGESIIAIGERTVNPVGIATCAEPRVPSAVFVMVTVYVVIWLMLTSVGDIVAVNEKVLA